MSDRAVEIGKLHRDSEANRIAIRDLLKQQKKECGHGKFLPWIEANRDALGFGIRQAQFYMMSDTRRVAYLNSRKFASRAEEIHEEKKAEQKRAAASKSALDAHLALNRSRDQRAFAEEFIASGYRAMSMKYHPDKGGTSDQQAAVTATRDLFLRLMAHPYGPLSLSGGAR